MSYGQGGTFFLAAYIGFIVATLLTGVLADLLNNRRVMLMAGVCMLLGVVGLNGSNNFGVWVLCMGVIGLGMGGIEVGGNGLMVELHSHKRARYLNLLATFHGVGSLLVPLLAAWLLAQELSWQQIYLFAGGLAAVLVAIFVLAGSTTQPAHAQASEGWDWAFVLKLGFTRRMCLFYLLISSYVAVELGLAAWMVEYLHQERQMSVGLGSLYLSGFFAMIMLGRLLGSWWVERIGYLRLVGLSLIGTLLTLTGGLYGPDSWSLLLPASGLCMSTVFPTITAAVSAGNNRHIGSLLGILFTFGGVGGALGPWIIGLVSDEFGLRTGLALTIGFGVVALVTLLALLERSESLSRPSLSRVDSRP